MKISRSIAALAGGAVLLIALGPLTYRPPAPPGAAARSAPATSSLAAATEHVRSAPPAAPSPSAPLVAPQPDEGATSDAEQTSHVTIEAAPNALGVADWNAASGIGSEVYVARGKDGAEIASIRQTDIVVGLDRKPPSDPEVSVYAVRYQGVHHEVRVHFGEDVHHVEVLDKSSLPAPVVALMDNLLASAKPPS
jgi:hypothetical protein